MSSKGKQIFVNIQILNLLLNFDLDPAFDFKPT